MSWPCAATTTLRSGSKSSATIATVARAAGLAVRINTVAMAGINDHEFDELVRWCGVCAASDSRFAGSLMPFGL